MYKYALGNRLLLPRTPDMRPSSRLLHTIVGLCGSPWIETQDEKYDAEDFSDVHVTQVTSINIEHAARRSFAKNHVVTLEQRHRQSFQLILPQLATVKRVAHALAFIE